MPATCAYCESTELSKEEPKVTYSKVFGPSIEEIIVCLLFLLAFKLCEKLGIVHKQNVKGIPCDDQGKGDDVNTWLSKEVKDLAVQLSMLGYDMNEPGLCLSTPSMFQARKFVLNRLAEIMEKKDELEGSSGSIGSKSLCSSAGDSLCS